MKKKKTILIITMYLVCLVAVIGIFLFYSFREQDKNKTMCYVTVTEIQAGQKIEQSLLATTFVQEEIHTSYRDSVEKYGSRLVTDASTLINKQAKSYIPAGVVITDSMFESMNTENKYENYVNPQYITLPVKTVGTPADGFEKDKYYSLIGMLSLNDLSNSENVDLQMVSSETWVGILTNKALLYTTISDEAGNVTYATFVVEKDVYPTLLIASSKAELYYLSGQLNDMSEVQSDVIKSIYESSGLATVQPFQLIGVDTVYGNTYELKSDYITVTETTDEETMITTVTKEVDKELGNLDIINLGAQNPLYLQWTGDAVNAFVRAYNTTGKKAKCYGTYSYASTESSRKINYDQNIEEHSFAIGFDEEGYYEIEFYNQAKDLIGVTRFIIETSEHEWEVSDISIDVLQKCNNIVGGVGTAGTTSVLPEQFEINYAQTGVKDYFKNIEALKDYKVEFTLTALGENNENAAIPNSITNTTFIVDKDYYIGSFLGQEINNIYICQTVDGNPVGQLPIYYKTDSKKIDAKVTNSQIQTINLMLGASVNAFDMKNKFSGYTQAASFIQLLEENKSSLFVDENKEDSILRNYLFMSKFLRLILLGEAITKEEYLEMVEVMYNVDEEGIATYKEGCEFYLLLQLKGSVNPVKIGLNFIPHEDFDIRIPKALATPVVTIDNKTGVASWKPISGASAYQYKTRTSLDGEWSGWLETTTTNVTIPLGTSIVVRAIDKDNDKNNSAESLEVVYSTTSNDDDAKLATPVVTIDKETGVASWEPISGASAYQYKVKDFYGEETEWLETTDTNLVMPLGASIIVRAIDKNNAKNNSEESIEVVYSPASEGVVTEQGGKI